VHFKLASFEKSENEQLSWLLLGQQIRLGITDEQLEMVIQLYMDGKLFVAEEIQQSDRIVVCSLGLQEC
jgi:hypothetical protein